MARGRTDTRDEADKQNSAVTNDAIKVKENNQRDKQTDHSSDK